MPGMIRVALACVVALGIMALTHAIVVANAETIAYKLASPTPAPLSDLELVQVLRETTKELDGLTDEESLKAIRTPSEFSIEEATRYRVHGGRFRAHAQSVRRGPVEKHWYYEVAPIKERLVRTTNSVYPFLYVVVALMGLFALGRWAWSAGLPMVREAVDALGLGGRAASWRLRQQETEFFRLKTLFENGLLTEEEFNQKKAEFRDAIEKSGLAKKR